MPSTIRYLNHILDKLSLVENVTYEVYREEYLLFSNGVMFGGIYDDRFLIEITKRSPDMIPYARFVKPFEDEKKEMLHVTEIGNRTVVKELINAVVFDINND